MGMLQDMVAVSSPFVLAWILWMTIVNGASVLFLGHRQGRAVLAAFIGAVVLMQVIYWATGFTRLLGLAHVICWTPLVVWLVGERPRLEGRLATWVGVVIVTNGASLVLDYVDVFRWLTGDGGQG